MKRTRIFSTATAILLSLILTLSLATVGVSATGTVTVTFNATVTSDVPYSAELSIGSTLNGWNPKAAGWYATRLDSNHFSLTVELDSQYVGQTIEYKWTLQREENADGNGWEYPESTGGSSGIFGNRTITIEGNDNVTNDTVAFSDKAVEIQPTLTRGTLDIIEMSMPQFSDGRTRTVRVWLPDGYNADDKSKKYSVLYMHDGQNLFDAATSFLGEWEVDESLSRLMDNGYESTIVVGIDNGETERFNELSPSWEISDVGRDYIASPQGEKYARFIVETVKPYIDEHYNTKTERAYTGIGGSSMGGIMSLYMAVEYADVFDYGLVLSPALHVYTDDTLDKFFDGYDFSSFNNLPKIYLFAGGATAGSEPGTPYDEACITKYVDIVKTDLTDRGYPDLLIGAYVDESLCHLETSWAEIFPMAMEWVSNAGAVLGDVNLDGSVDIKDATAIQKHIANLEKLNGAQKNLADTDGDGDISIKDATQIQKYIARLITSLE